MNTKQIVSLATWLANALSGAMIAYTAAKSPAAQSVGVYVSQLVTGPDTIAAFVLVISWLVSHLMHATPVPTIGDAIKITNKPPGTALLLAFCLSAAIMTGCATSPQKATYEAAGVTQMSVETALQAYNQFAAAVKTTPAQNAAVKAAYLKYQAAFAVVCDAGAAYAASGSSTNAPALSLALTQALQNSDQTISDFVALVKSFGVKM